MRQEIKRVPPGPAGGEPARAAEKRQRGTWRKPSRGSRSALACNEIDVEPSFERRLEQTSIIPTSHRGGVADYEFFKLLGVDRSDAGQ